MWIKINRSCFKTEKEALKFSNMLDTLKKRVEYTTQENNSMWYWFEDIKDCMKFAKFVLNNSPQ